MGKLAVLYGGKVYACRHCHRLAYSTQREQSHDLVNQSLAGMAAKLGILRGGLGV